MQYRIKKENRFSEWAVGVKSSDNSVFEVYRWLGRALRGKDAKYREINWLAARLPELRERGILSSEEIRKVGAMLGSGSITLEEGAKEMLALAYPRQGEALGKMLLDVLAHGRRDAVWNAMDAVFMAGDASCMCAVAQGLVHFREAERRRIARRMESLARENGAVLDLPGLKEKMKEAAAELCRKGEAGASEEMRRYLLDIRKAAREAALDGKKGMGRRLDGNGRERPLRKAASY